MISLAQFISLLFILYLLFGDTVTHTNMLKRYIKQQYYEYKARKAEEKKKEQEEAKKLSSKTPDKK